MEAKEMAEELKRWGAMWGSWIGPKGDESRYKRMAECAYAGSDAIAERDQLRAEVERLRAQTKAALLNAKQSQDGWNEALNERNALQSTAAGLRRALEEARQFSRDAAYGASIHAADSAICDSARRAEDVCIAALTATSDAHGRRIKAAAYREAARRILDDPRRWPTVICNHIAHDLCAEADRLEKEATNGNT